MYQLFANKFWEGASVPVHFEARNPQPPFPLHTHDFFELVIVLNGTGMHITNQGSKEIKAGDVFCVKPGQAHGFSKVDNLVLTNIMLLNSFLYDSDYDLKEITGFSTLFEPLSRAVAATQPIQSFNLNKFQLFEIQAIIESVKQEITNQNLGYKIQVHTLLIQLIMYLLRVFNNRNFSSSTENTSAVSLIAFMEKNYKTNISMPELTDMSNMSESSVLRTFKRITGYAPFVYQNRLRMFDASNQLTQTNKTVTEIAYDLGYNDSNYFCRCFRKFMNMSPTEYRKHFS